MCARATLTVSEDDLVRTFGYQMPEGYRPSYNLAPGDRLLAIGEHNGVRGFRRYRWGLVPFWADNERIGRRLINCRSETVGSKPAFRAAYAKRRCLVLVDGFYEWQRTPAGKQPHRICMKDRQPFTLAAIWEGWQGGEGLLETVAVLTTAPNRLMQRIHERMPVIVPPTARNAWLSSEAARGDLDALLHPYGGDDLEAYEVSALVNDPRRDLPECIAPIDPPLTLL